MSWSSCITTFLSLDSQDSLHSPSACLYNVLDFNSSQLVSNHFTLCSLSSDNQSNCKLTLLDAKDSSYVDRLETLLHLGLGLNTSVMLIDPRTMASIPAQCLAMGIRFICVVQSTHTAKNEVDFLVYQAETGTYVHYPNSPVVSVVEAISTLAPSMNVRLNNPTSITEAMRMFLKTQTADLHAIQAQLLQYQLQAQAQAQAQAFAQVQTQAQLLALAQAEERSRLEAAKRMQKPVVPTTQPVISPHALLNTLGAAAPSTQATGNSLLDLLGATIPQQQSSGVLKNSDPNFNVLKRLLAQQTSPLQSQMPQTNSRDIVGDVTQNWQRNAVAQQYQQPQQQATGSWGIPDTRNESAQLQQNLMQLISAVTKSADIPQQQIAGQRPRQQQSQPQQQHSYTKNTSDSSCVFSTFASAPTFLLFLFSFSSFLPSLYSSLICFNHFLLVLDNRTGYVPTGQTNVSYCS
eukprot:TRINITY_DN306_c0_g1_i4.p1 TRINITY_DN306_c0_g1~~TRINITY_DN306_c0_g1_i4.p1  ORF type:complete len:462 (+),score=53.27 TRINITY_DN306_c0_g1_i4:967-2352(+)